MAERIILDTNVFLNVSNKEEEFYESSKTLLDLVDTGEVEALVSMVTVAELSTGYRISGEEKLWQKTLLHLLASKNFTLVDMDVRVADMTGEIRSRSRLTTPDAIIVASGLIHDASYLVTNDSDFNKIPKELRAISPSEYIKMVDG